MKHTAFYTIIPSISGLILPVLFLCGFLFSRTTGPMLPTWGTRLSEKQALWSRFIGYSPEAHTSELSTFTPDKSLLIIKQAQRILAIETKSGHIRWQRHLSRYTLTNPATTNSTRIFIATAEPRLLALDINTGDVVWSVALPHMVLATAATNQHQVVVKTISGDVLAFHAKNGKPLWHYKQASHPSMMLHQSSAPQLTQDQVFVGFPNGKLLALNRDDGELNWEHTITRAETGAEFDKLIDIAADPIIDIENSVIYVNAYHGMLQCLSLETGNIKWECPFSGHMSFVLGKHLYGLDEDHIVYAFNKTDGSIVWEQTAFKAHKAVSTNYRIIGPILTAQGKQLVLADQEGSLYWLSSEDGNIIGQASFSISSPILSLPLTQNNTVYVMNRRSQVAAWNNPAMPSLSSITEQSTEITTSQSVPETIRETLQGNSKDTTIQTTT